MQVLVEGQPPQQLRSRKTLWLLALLTLRQNRPVERAWLAGTLWPDGDQARGFSNLRPIVSELRKMLGGQAHRLQSPNRHTLYLDLTGTEVDIHTFDAAISDQNIPSLQCAVTLYRGPLLEGCTEEWIFPEREKREQDCLQALQILGDSAREAGNYEAAIPYYRRAISLDPWRETARRGLMHSLAQSGDRNAARNVYREYAAKLRETPSLAPDAETRSLYDRLRTETSSPIASSLVEVTESPTATITGYVPHALTELIGREDERLEVAHCLRRSRLVTLTGVGGIGKTRLALALAQDVLREYVDGVWLVALDSLFEEQEVIARIAAVLGVKEEAGRSLRICVGEHLRQKHLLLVLDNCEHLLAESAGIAGQLLAECAEIRILATSREAMGITGETVWAVPSLPTPDPMHLPEGHSTLHHVMAGYEGIQLFIERAQAVQKSFSLTESNASALAQICFRLEGIPLAIELAAARVRMMTVEQIAARLDSALLLLTGGSRTAQARQQTLRATLDWSYELLSPSERLLLQRLSVFRGGWTLEAAEAICGDNEMGEDPSPLLKQSDIVSLLTALVDKSLINFVEGKKSAGRRFQMLEMVRQFADERLAASSEASSLRTRHQNWFVALGEEGEAQLRGPKQSEWLDRLTAEYDNLRMVLSHSTKDASSAESALRLTAALRLFWHIRCDYSEARKYLTQTLEQRDGQAPTPARAKALNAFGVLERGQMNFAAAQALHEESLVLYRELGDKKGIAQTTGHLGSIQSDRGDYVAAQSLYEESLRIRRQLEDKTGVAYTLYNLSVIAEMHGDFARAKKLLEESLLLYRQSGSKFHVARILNVLGLIVSTMGDLANAEALHEESLSCFKELGDRSGIACARIYQGKIAIRQGDYRRARELYQEGLSVFRDLDETTGITSSLFELAEAAFRQGELNLARSLYEESLSAFKERRHKPGTASTLSKLGIVAFAQGDDTTGRALFQECLPLFKEMGKRLNIAETLHALASAMQERDGNFAVCLWGATHTLWESMGAVLPLPDQEKYKQDLCRARSIQEEDTFVSAWEAGRALTWEQAVDYALRNGICPSR